MIGRTKLLKKEVIINPMTETKNGHAEENGEAMSEEETQPQFNILTQYLKDLSFESPNSPNSLKGTGENPNIQIGINVSGQNVEEDTYEVVLELTADAKIDDNYLYKLEIVYAGLFHLKDIPDEILKQVLFVDCPIIIFPFLRQNVVQLTQEGGFPPLQLDPIDFGRLFHENIAKAQEEQEEKQVIN